MNGDEGKICTFDIGTLLTEDEHGGNSIKVKNKMPAFYKMLNRKRYELLKSMKAVISYFSKAFN